MVMLFGLLLLNFAISWFNAASVGRGYAEAKAAGGFAIFLAWCGLVMSACGFTWTYVAILGLGAEAAGKITPEQAALVFDLGYVVIIFPVLGSGLAIMVESWASFYRKRTLGSGARAAWNTYAQISNSIEAYRGFGPALGRVLDGLGGKKGSKGSKGGGGAIVVLIVVLALAGGALTTAAIFRSSAARAARRVQSKMGFGGGYGWNR